MPGVIANKSHHATTPDEKYRVVPYAELYVDAGFASAAEAASRPASTSGRPSSTRRRLSSSPATASPEPSVDDRAGCAVMVEVARALLTLAAPPDRAPRLLGAGGVQPARRASPRRRRCMPDIAIQLDLILATDTPDMASARRRPARRRPGHEPLLLPRPRHAQRHHPPSGAGRRSSSEAREALGLPLQRSAHIGALTDSAYVQLVGAGVAAIDLGFPMRYTHSSLEVCDLADLAGLTQLLVAGARRDRPGLQPRPRRLFDR